MISWSDGRKRDSLPIDDRLPHILDLLKHHQVVVCEAETGAGKTTRIGQAAILTDPTLRVTMTQTRRNACRWNCQRIASEMGCKPGQLVGYSLSGDERKVVSEATRLELVVDQTLTNRIRSRRELPDGLIIVDEAHERSVSIDLLLGLIKDSLSRSPKTRILVMSATIDTKKFSAFFGGAPIVNVQGRCFPVSTEVLTLSYGEHHTEAAARAASMVMQRFLLASLFVADETVVKKGTVLVLLPGKEDIDFVKKYLLQEAKGNPKIEILSCHGQNSMEEQDRAQTIPASNTLRFLCCTELLRNSITVPETVGVVDSLQVKRRITDAKGVAHLDKIPISKAEADQGKGRAGRTGPGFYIPVSFQSEYEHLTAWPQPAILREPLGHVALQVACIGRSIRKFDFIDAPPSDKVELTVRRLKALNALAEDESITETGRLLARFPLDPEQAKALLTAHQLGILSEAVIVTAVLEVEEFFYRGYAENEIFADEALTREILKHTKYTLDLLPPWISKDPKGDLWQIKCRDPDFPNREGGRWVVDLQRKIWAGASQSDFAAIVRAYRAFKKMESSLGTYGRKSDKPLEQWCTARGLKLKQLRLVEEKMRQIMEDVASANLKIEHDLRIERVFDEAALTKALASGKMDNLARKSPGSRFSGRLGEFKLAYESSCPAETELVLVAGVRKIPTKHRNATTHLLLADLAAPLKPAWLLEVAPHLCKCVRRADHCYNPDLDLVEETETITFQNDLMMMHKVASDAANAAKVFASWFVRQPPDLLPSHLAQVLRSNAQREKLAKQLNVRAGQTIFETFSEEKHLFARLTGARRIQDVKPAVLAFAPLDEVVVKRIVAENPDTIHALGEALQVEYRELHPPRVVVPAQLAANNRWSALFAHPMQLPSGRALEFEISVHPGISFTLTRGINRRAVLSHNLSGLDLSGVDLSGVELSKITYDATTKFPLNVSNKQPYFLANSELEQETQFTRALDRYCITHPQSEDIVWCIAMQVIEHGSSKKTVRNLKALSSHVLVNPAILMRAINFVWGIFGNAETKVQTAIRKAIEAIEKSERSSS